MSVAQSIIESIESQVERTPQRIAITCASDTLTFAELNAMANRLSRVLLEQSIGVGARVVIITDNEPLRLVTALAVLKTGAAFVQLNANDPDDVLCHLIGHAQPLLVLVTEKHRARVAHLHDEICPVLPTEALMAGEDSANICLTVSPASLAYIQYTSGSTGSPKGVMVSHRSAAFVRDVCIDSNQLVASDQVALFSTLWFSHIWATLSVGGCLHIYDLALRGVNGIAEWMQNCEITIYSTFPTAFRHFAETLEPSQRLESVRVVSLTGESVSGADIELCRQHIRRDGVFINCYASTELVYVSNYIQRLEQGRSDEPIHIGQVVDGVTLSLLDDNRQPVADGVIGELAIITSNLSLGYWRNPTLTAERFIDVPDSGDTRMFLGGDMAAKNAAGQIFLSGRKDQLIKVRGFRVLPNEVETALIDHPDILNVGVTSFHNSNNDRRLVAYYTSQSIISSPVLTDHMKICVPSHMVPSLFVRVDELPLTSSGKVDRRKLPAPKSVSRVSMAACVEACSHIESTLVTIWESLLGITGVGVNDDFFELGGDSLQATRLLMEVSEAFSVALLAEDLLTKTNTIRTLAIEIEHRLATRAGATSLSSGVAPRSRTYVEPKTNLRRYYPNSHVLGMTINSLGFRSPEITVTKPASTIRLAFLGDSFTLDANAGESEQTWPHQVVDSLRIALPENSFDYVNAALPACHSKLLTRMYASNVAKLSPDVVVIQAADTIADTTALAKEQGLYDGIHHRPSRFARSRELFRKIEMNLLILLRLGLAQLRHGKLEFDTKQLGDAFEQRLTQLATTCGEQASLLVFVTICSRLRGGQSFLQRLRGAETSVYLAPYLHVDSFLELADAYNNVIRCVAEKHAAILIDVEQLVPTGRQFFADSMHLRAPGSRLVAGQLADKLLQHPTLVSMCNLSANK